MANYGFKISKPGFDVKTCTDKQCIFTSKYGSMKVRMSGIKACTAGVWTDITHSFGYNPNYFCFIDDVDSEGSNGIFPMGFLDTVFDAGLYLHTYTTTAKLYLKSKNTKNVYYYLFAEKGA